MRRLGSTFFTEQQFRASYVRDSATQLFEERLAKSQSETSTYHVFLSHSSRDKVLVLNFKSFLQESGFKVYIDWIDDSDSGRDEITPKLKKAMQNSGVLLYLHTHNARLSRWTPWEIGFFDSLKGSSKIAVMPLLDSNNRIAPYDGQEYLSIYTEIGSSEVKSFSTRGL